MAQRTTQPPRRAAARKAPILRPSDFLDHLRRRAALMAPTDIETLVSQASALRRRAVTDGRQRPAFQREIELALDVLSDHAGGRCPQIPYSTVALLAAALFYYLDPLDVIPDCIPVVGTGDDALVMALACREGAAGLERYCVWKGVPTLVVPPAPRGRRTT
jgi:uncharacterized membrane protein YkvA (DUF1232 family)